MPIDDSDTVVAFFDSSVEAYEYFRQGKGKFMNVDFPNRTYSVNTVLGVSPETQYIINMIRMVINTISIVLGIIAAVVVIFTSIRLIDQDKQNIALYYSLGATTGQARMIYLCYFLELMIGAAVLAFGLASAVVLAFSFLNQEFLGIQAALGFNLPAISEEIWYAINFNTFIIIAFILAMAIICIAVNSKKIAKMSFESM